MLDNIWAKQVKRFDGTNYQGWKFQITAVLTANEIYDVVDGSRTMPEDRLGPNENLAKEWVKDNAKATAIIASSMEYTQMETVFVCKTAK